MAISWPAVVRDEPPLGCCPSEEPERFLLRVLRSSLSLERLLLLSLGIFSVFSGDDQLLELVLECLLK